MSAVQSIVNGSRASAIRIDGLDGAVLAATPNPPAQPWVLCAPIADVQPQSTGTAPGALAAAVPIRDAAGRTTGYAYAAQALDAAYVQRLSTDVGAAVSVAGDQPAKAPGSTYVRTVAPIAGQPFEIAITVPMTKRAGLIRGGHRCDRARGGGRDRRRPDARPRHGAAAGRAGPGGR